MLLEHAREADDGGLFALDVLKAPREEGAYPATGANDAVDDRRGDCTAPCHVARPLTQDLLDVPLDLFGGLIRARVRKNPLPRLLALRQPIAHRDGRVQAFANLLGEGNCEIADRRRDTAGGEQRLEQAEAERGPEERPEWHRDEDDVRHQLPADAVGDDPGDGVDAVADEGAAGGRGAATGCGGGMSCSSGPKLAPRRNGRLPISGLNWPGA